MPLRLVYQFLRDAKTKYHKLCVLKLQKCIFLQLRRSWVVLKVWDQEGSRAIFLLKFLEEEEDLSSPFVGFWWLLSICGSPWLVDASLPSLPPSTHSILPCVPVSAQYLLRRTPHLSLITSAVTLFPSKFTFTDTSRGSDLNICFWRMQFNSQQPHLLQLTLPAYKTQSENIFLPLKMEWIFVLENNGSGLIVFFYCSVLCFVSQLTSPLILPLHKKECPSSLSNPFLSSFQFPSSFLSNKFQSPFLLKPERWASKTCKVLRSHSHPKTTLMGILPPLAMLKLPSQGQQWPIYCYFQKLVLYPQYLLSLKSIYHN